MDQSLTSILSTLFAVISALIAAAAIYFPSRTNKSQQTLDQAIKSLERSYEALTSEGKQITPPAPDRLNWLTAARHIERYKQLKSSLKDSIHKTIAEEQEEYWRHKFYLCLQSQSLIQPGYYEGNPKLSLKLGIEPSSAIVVHAFAKWPEDRLDPIDTVNIDSLIANGRALEGNVGLRAYLESIPKFSKKLKSNSEN